MNALTWIATASLVLVAATAAFAGGIGDVKVTTDRSIDCSSLAAIAHDLYRDCKSDEEKAVATWYFVRRLHFHWPHIPTWDSIDLINSYGFALCGYQSNMYCQIAAAGGLKVRTMHPTSHVIAEAWYDDAWHMFDCQVGWFARNRKGAVASVEELKADPTLVTDAIKEGRASAPYFQCRDNPASGTNYAATARLGGSPRPIDKRLVINLRRGESIVRHWANEGKSWYKPGETNWTQPRHSCTGQTIDANDPVNWPYWKPYAQVARTDGDKVIYGVKRTYGNGRAVYEPDLAGAFADGLAPDGLQGVAGKGAGGGGPNLHPAKAAEAATATFTIDLPYVGVDAWLDLEGVRKTEQDQLAVYTKRPSQPWKKVWTPAGTGKIQAEKIPLKDAAWFGHGFQVKFEMTAAAAAGDVGIDRFKVTSVFMNNIYSLPYLMPGENTIRLTAAEGADLSANALTLEYAWQEQGKDKTFTQRITRLPFEHKLTVAGKDLPRMKYVKLSVAP
ncbi:MAG TPA: hypothetical protein VM389_03480 [Phycisphaerae bacterium]|nr:hypothetical protein [Phycisphaerae bacterium]HUU21575.1 hypothetical protein [Phycisphaerae bacterium]